MSMVVSTVTTKVELLSKDLIKRPEGDAENVSDERGKKV
jgi:hypothetical protein